MSEPVEIAGWEHIRKLWSDNPTVKTMIQRLTAMGISTQKYNPRVNVDLFREKSKELNHGEKR